MPEWEWRFRKERNQTGIVVVRNDSQTQWRARLVKRLKHMDKDCTIVDERFATLTSEKLKNKLRNLKDTMTNKEIKSRKLSSGKTSAPNLLGSETLYEDCLLAYRKDKEAQQVCPCVGLLMATWVPCVGDADRPHKLCLPRQGVVKSIASLLTRM